MAPELNPGVAKDIAQRRSTGKFVRRETVIFIEERLIDHRGIAKEAGFIHGDHFVVDDAGRFRGVPESNAIEFYGDSLGFNTKETGPARDNTIEVAQEIVGNSVAITDISKRKK